MIESKNTKYVAKLIGMIDFRYYVIEVHNKYYIIDYANPKDIRTYFSGLFPKYNTDYKIYDITETRSQYKIKDIPWYFKELYSIIEYGILILFLIFLLIPKNLNPVRLLYSHAIVENWAICLVIIFIIALLIILFLIQHSNGIEDFPDSLKEKEEVLKMSGFDTLLLKTKKTFFSKTISDLVSILLGVPACLFIGIVSSNYFFLIVFGFLGTYQMLLSRFLNLNIVLRKNKVQITKK